MLSFQVANQKKKNYIKQKSTKSTINLEKGATVETRMENEETACEHSYIIQLANRKSMRASLTHLRINP